MRRVKSGLRKKKRACLTTCPFQFRFVPNVASHDAILPHCLTAGLFHGSAASGGTCAGVGESVMLSLPVMIVS